MPLNPTINRRVLLGTGATLAASAALARLSPAWAQSGSHGTTPHMRGGQVLSGNRIELDIGDLHFSTGDRSGHAIVVNGSLPGPLIRLVEGQDVELAVTNRLAEQSSIHWHGLLLPFQMDGVPGLSFPGIDPGETFTYRFPIVQAGTYWYHSHSGMQEAMGLYGPIVIDPATPDPVAFDREHVIVLADWSPVHPHEQMRRLKAMGGYYNRQRQTLESLLAGRDQTLEERLVWAQMLMDPTDISDVTAATYSYLINGHGTAENWTGLFTPGERVKLRIINASAMTNFNFRIPGLTMTVVAADGCTVQPVQTDEFQIAVAETYDVIVSPQPSQPFAIIAEALDRSGLVRATLAPQMGMVAELVPLRSRPLLTMRDMGMDMAAMDMGNNGVIDLSQPISTAEQGHSMAMRDPSVAPQVPLGPGVASLAPMPVDRLADRPTGLEDAPHSVLTYADLQARDANPDQRVPSRQIDVHLTANMERYMWSMDGETISDGAQPLPFRLNERARINLINDTMMPHPIHLHGHFFELVNGASTHKPRKHTVNVLPGARVSFDFTADAAGDWAFHCHMLMHMHSGMMRVVTVRDYGDGA